MIGESQSLAHLFPCTLLISMKELIVCLLFESIYSWIELSTIILFTFRLHAVRFQPLYCLGVGDSIVCRFCLFAGFLFGLSCYTYVWVLFVLLFPSLAYVNSLLVYTLTLCFFFPRSEPYTLYILCIVSITWVKLTKTYTLSIYYYTQRPTF